MPEKLTTIEKLAKLFAEEVTTIYQKIKTMQPEEDLFRSICKFIKVDLSLLDKDKDLSNEKVIEFIRQSKIVWESKAVIEYIDKTIEDLCQKN